jgi:glycosyltransferase involved in cell wall biosynthesis
VSMQKRIWNSIMKMEIMWVETVDKLLEDENLRKSYSEKAKQRAEDFRIEKIVKEWKEILR